MSTQARRPNKRKNKRGTTEARSSSCGFQQPKAARDVTNLPIEPSLSPPHPTTKSTASQIASPSAPTYMLSAVPQQHVFIDIATYDTTKTHLDRLAADHERLKATYDLHLSETNGQLKARIARLEADLNKSLEENKDLQRRNEVHLQDMAKTISQLSERVTAMEEQIRNFHHHHFIDRNARLERSKREFRTAFVGAIGFNFVRRVFIQVFPDKELPGGVSLDFIERSCRSEEQKEALDTLIPSTHRTSFKQLLRDVAHMRLGMAPPTSMFRETASDPVVYPTVEDLRAEVKLFYGDVQTRSIMDEIIAMLAKLVMEQDKNLDNLLTNFL